MKGSRIYMAFLFVFLMLVFLFEYMAPHKFTWDPTYDKNDKEPFGSYVFDDILSSSIDNYSVSNKTFYQLFKEDSTITRHAFLVTEKVLTFSSTDIEYLYKLIQLGNQVMICVDDFPYTLEDTLRFVTKNKGYFPSISNYILEKKSRDSIFFGTDTLNPERIFEVYPHLHPTSLSIGRIEQINEVTHMFVNKMPKITITKFNSIDSISIKENEVTIYDDELLLVEPSQAEYDSDNVNEDSLLIEESNLKDESSESRQMGTGNDSDSINKFIIYKGNKNDTIKNIKKFTIIRKTKPEFVSLRCDSMEVLAWNSKNEPLVVRAIIGKGEIILVATPLMLTNYGMLDGNNASYAFRLLSYMKDKPLIRLEGYGKHGSNQDTPLRFILSQPSLQWALYFSLLLLIAFMFFTAKRRQRIIPVVNSPQNKSMEFMQLISNLFYQRHDNAELLKMKHTYFCAEVKANTGIDLQEALPNDQDFQRLSEKTGIEIKKISDLLKNIQMANYRSEVDDINLKKYIDGMNEIIKKIYYG